MFSFSAKHLQMRNNTIILLQKLLQIINLKKSTTRKLIIGKFPNWQLKFENGRVFVPLQF